MLRKHSSVIKIWTKDSSDIAISPFFYHIADTVVFVWYAKCRNIYFERIKKIVNGPYSMYNVMFWCNLPLQKNLFFLIFMSQFTKADTMSNKLIQNFGFQIYFFTRSIRVAGESLASWDQYTNQYMYIRNFLWYYGVPSEHTTCRNFYVLVAVETFLRTSVTVEHPWKRFKSSLETI